MHVFGEFTFLGGFNQSKFNLAALYIYIGWKIIIEYPFGNYPVLFSTKKNDGKFALGLKLMHKDPLQKKRKSEEMKFIRRKVDARDLHTI